MTKQRPASQPASPTLPVEEHCEPVAHRPRQRSQAAPSGRAFRRAASLFRALGEESRLRLLERLADGRWCVSELAEAAGSPISTVSQQLRILRNEGLVARERSGKHIYYGLADEHVRDLVMSALAHADEPDPDAGSHAHASDEEP